MLRLLKIRNFALIEDITVDFNQGLSVITGETGAGKSMIVEAISTLCGSKMEEVLIRSSKSFAEVTGIFTINNDQTRQLQKSGIETNGEIIIRRKIERGKRQSSFLNDQIVSLNLLREIAKGTVDLVGQYENQSLFFPRNHLSLLDSYANLDKPKNKYHQCYQKFRILEHELEQILEKMRQKDEKMDLLSYQVKEIEKANLQSNEEEELQHERTLLASSEKRTALSAQINNILYEKEGSIVEQLAGIKKDFDELSTHDSNMQSFVEEIENICSMVDDIFREISSYQNSIEFSQERLDYVQDRLATIATLKKKYGKTIEEVQGYLQKIKSDLSQIETRDEEVKRLKSEITEKKKEVMEQAQELTRLRIKAARGLKEKILDILAQLGMKKANFQIKIDDCVLGDTGKDNVEFYISTNPGEVHKPLRKVASGGEISRITLSLKTILSDVDKIPTIIFDEVDTGIGGSIAEAVGDLLAQLSDRHQVICVTHLPQISIYANSHYLVKKDIKNKQTYTQVVQLNEKERKKEIARMLGGKKITKKTMEHATEFLQRVRKR